MSRLGCLDCLDGLRASAAIATDWRRNAVCRGKKDEAGHCVSFTFRPRIGGAKNNDSAMSRPEGYAQVGGGRLVLG